MVYHITLQVHYKSPLAISFMLFHRPWPWRSITCARLLEQLCAGLSFGFWSQKGGGRKGAEEGFCGSGQVLRLARNLRPGAILVDAGVFDGTDWSLMGILAGATVLGFEPLRENRKLVDERLPAQLHQHGHPQGTIAQAYSFLPIAPGEPAQASDLAAMTCRDFKVVMHGFAEARRKLTVYLEVPRMPWLQIAPAGSRQRLSGDGTFPVTFPCDLSLRIPWLCDALQDRP